MKANFLTKPNENKHARYASWEKQVAELETSIEKMEQQVSALENRMATPEGAADMSLYQEHQKLKEQIAAAETEWETISLELEELK